MTRPLFWKNEVPEFVDGSELEFGELFLTFVGACVSAPEVLDPGNVEVVGGAVVTESAAFVEVVPDGVVAEDWGATGVADVSLAEPPTGGVAAFEFEFAVFEGVEFSWVF
jgi:hypothetical protein